MLFVLFCIVYNLQILPYLYNHIVIEDSDRTQFKCQIVMSVSYVLCYKIEY